MNLTLRSKQLNTHYLDHAASTPLRPGVWEAMGQCAGTAYANASSSHRWGRAAREALESARERVAAVLGASPREVVFTQGGTEANNMAVRGCARRVDSPAATVISSIEHPAVREAAESLPYPVVEIPCRTGTGLDLEAVNAALDESPALVSVMWVNNETGDLLPVRPLAELCAEREVLLHSDAVQAVGKIPVRVDEVAVDMLTLTAHKFGGPKGAGALFIRAGTPIAPLLFGGGQERGLRPGTSNVTGAVGLATALEAATADLASEAARLTALRDRLAEGLCTHFPTGTLHCATDQRAPHIVNFGVPDQDRSVLLAALDLAGIAASGGSACSSGASGPSPIIAALYGDDHPLTAVRFSLGWTTTQEDVDAALATLIAVTDTASSALTSAS